jgi:catechol 2,3-dioxygenase-like lactoylglutathione lyase family enzyme
MSDYSTPNLPSSDFDRTLAFYEKSGFQLVFRNPFWMILKRGDLVLEFFPMQIDPYSSSFSTCFRVDKLDEVHAAFVKTEVSRKNEDIPRLGDIGLEPSGLRLFYVVDPDGSLIRCIDNLQVSEEAVFQPES